MRAQTSVRFADLNRPLRDRHAALPDLDPAVRIQEIERIGTQTTASPYEQQSLPPSPFHGTYLEDGWQAAEE